MTQLILTAVDLTILLYPIIPLENLAYGYKRWDPSGASGGL
jgi:hypothetical protein